MHLPARKSGKNMKLNRARLFKKFRNHQRVIAANGGGALTTLRDSGRTEITFASAPYGEHAVSAFWSAIAHQNFQERLHNRAAK